MSNLPQTPLPSRLPHDTERVPSAIILAGYPFKYDGDSPIAQWVKNIPAMQKTQEMQVWILSREDALEEEMTAHFRVLA